MVSAREGSFNYLEQSFDIFAVQDQFINRNPQARLNQFKKRTNLSPINSGMAFSNGRSEGSKN